MNPDTTKALALLDEIAEHMPLNLTHGREKCQRLKELLTNGAGEPPRGSVLAELVGDLRQRAEQYRDASSRQSLVQDQLVYEGTADDFDRAADALERAADAPKEGWVRVEDAELVYGEPYWVFNGANVIRSYYTQRPNHIGTHWSFSDVHGVTHVMPYYAPLPPAPTQEGEER